MTPPLPSGVTSLWTLAGWTMLHFAWMGTLLALVAALGRLLLRATGTGPDARHSWSLLTFLALAATPPAIALSLARATVAVPPTPPATSPPREPETHAWGGPGWHNPGAEGTRGPDWPGAPVEPQIDQPAPTSLDWPPDHLSLATSAASWLPALWLAGAPLTFAYLACGLAGAERLRRAARPLDPESPLHRHAAALARRRQLHSAPIAVCPRITAPLLLGIVRPLILLPPAALTGWSPDLVEMALLHELAHLRRHDNLVNLLQRLVESALWFHPAVWLVSSWLRRDRESCCDRIVVAATGRPRDYAEALLALHDTRRPRVVAPSVAMSEAPLVARVRSILGMEDPIMRLSTTTLAATAALFLAPAALVAAALWSPQDPKPPDATYPVPAKPAPAPSDTSRTIRIRVVDAANQSPLAGARVVVKSYRLGYDIKRLETGPDGRAAVSIPDPTPEFIRVAVAADGRVPLVKSYDWHEFSAAAASEAVFALQKGEEIGGLVHDETGQPIVNATVYPWVIVPRIPDTNGGPTSLATSDFPVRTDTEGRWRAPYLPPGTTDDDPPPAPGADRRRQVLVRLVHPDFVSEPSGYSRTMTIAEARSGQNVQVMSEGAFIVGRIAGRTRDTAPGAVIYSDLYDLADEPRPVPAEFGRFRLDHLPFGRNARADAVFVNMARFVVVAPGFAPEVLEVSASPRGTAVTVRLDPARPLSGRVVDSAGQPVPGTTVSVGRYKECRVIPWRAATDADGRFTWPDGPVAGEVELQAYAPGFLRVINHKATSGDKDVSIVLHRPTRVRGTVTDADTGAPIERFSLTSGEGPFFDDRKYFWHGNSRRETEGGRFDESRLFVFDQTGPIAVKIEAEGYEPATLEGFTTADELVERDVKLVRKP